MSETRKIEMMLSRFGFSMATVASLTLWFFCNIATVILNKYIYTALNFKYPMTLTAIHMLTCFIGSIIAIHFVGLTKYQPITSDYLLKRVVPLTILFFVNIALGNISLKFISVAFMQTVKSSVPIFSVILQVVFWKRSFAKNIYYSLIPVVGGMVLATWTEMEYNDAGFYSALLASCVTALMAIVSGNILAGKLDSLNLVYYTTPLSFVFLLPFIWVGEGTELSEWYQSGEDHTGTIFTLFLSGCIAYLLNVSTFLVIANTSALTYNVAGNFKVVFSIVFSVWFFSSPISGLNALGCATAILGVFYYNHIRQQSTAEAKPKELEKIPDIESGESTKTT